VFTQPVFEKMQASLKNSVPKRKRGEGEEKSAKKPRPRLVARPAVRKRRRWLNEICVSDHSPSGHHRKRLAIKENQNTLVFQVAAKATKTEIKEAVQEFLR
jgi:hypothetical protein